MKQDKSVELQMNEAVEYAIKAAKEKYGCQLDFSDSSLLQLDSLLQRAHEWYLRASDGGIIPSIPIENTSRAWGSYLGEMIRRRTGGEWIEIKNAICLIIDTRILDPIGMVRNRIRNGPQIDIQTYFEKEVAAQSKRVSDPDDEFRKREQEYQNKLAQMEGTLVLTLSKLDVAEKRISELLNKSSLEKQIAENQSDEGKNQLNAELKTLRLQIGEMQALIVQKDALMLTLGQAKSDLDFYNQKISQKKNDIRELEQEESSLQSELESIKNEIQTRKTELDSLQVKKKMTPKERISTKESDLIIQREDGYYGELPDFIK